MVRPRPCLDWERLCVRPCLYACGGLRASADVPFISCAAFSPNSKRAVRSQVHEVNTWTDRHGLPSHLARAAARFHCHLPRRRARRSSVSALRSIHMHRSPLTTTRFATKHHVVVLASLTHSCRSPTAFLWTHRIRSALFAEACAGARCGRCCVVSSYN